MKILIVGGVAGGASAAARLRRLSEDNEITIFERGDHISYANCGLPYYVGGVIEDEEDLLLQTPESFYARFHVQVRLRHEVISVLPDKKQVLVRDLQKRREYLEEYDALLLSPGANPINPFGESAVTLRTVEDALSLRVLCENGQMERALVIGGGFIGLEAAENLIACGIKVTLAEKMNHVMPNMDREMTHLIEKKLKKMGVDLRIGCGVKELRRGEAILDSGEKLSCDLAVCAIGTHPCTDFLKSSGIAMTEKGAIQVDGRLRTNLPDVYAVGDAVAIPHKVTGKTTNIPLAGPANRQGRLAADAIMGREVTYTGAQGAAILKLGDMTVASAGASESQLKAANIPYTKSYTHSLPHAGYYPGGHMMSVKLLFAPDGSQVLGAQIVGYEGVDKAIDLFSTAISREMSVFDLAELELSYAPPFSSAKAPVNIAGYVASNIAEGLHEVFYSSDIPDLDPNTDLLVDIRTQSEYDKGTIPGAILLPLDEIRARCNELPRDKNLYIFCRIGQRGYYGYRQLKLLGFEHVKNLSGGFMSYMEAQD